jgi:hypothetical protein
VTGKKILLYLSMSEAVIPNILFNSFMSHSGLGGGGPGGTTLGGPICGGGIGPGIGIGGSRGGHMGGGPPMWCGCMLGGGASSSYRPIREGGPLIRNFPPTGP